MRRNRPVRHAAVTMNGIGIAYFMGVVNAALAAVTAFGVNLNPVQQASLATLVNASIALAVHLSHRIGEVEAAGGSGEMSRAQTAKIVAEVTPTHTADVVEVSPPSDVAVQV